MEGEGAAVDLADVVEIDFARVFVVGDTQFDAGAIAFVGVEVEAAFDAGRGCDEAIGQLVVGGPGHRAEVIDFAEAVGADEEQPLPEVQGGEEAAGAGGLVASVSDGPNSAPDWPSGITMSPFFSVSVIATSPPAAVLPVIFQFQPVSAKSPWAR